MISKKKLAASLAAVASIALISGSTFGAVSASASAAAVCTVDGAVTVTNGPPNATTPAAGTDSFAFAGVTIGCHGTAPIDGNWTNVTASGGSNSNAGGGETCGEATGSGHFNSGNNGGNSITGGTFTFKRAGALVQVTGTITSSAGNFSFASTLTFTPTSGGCYPGPGGGASTTTNADMHGTAQIYQA